MPNKAQDLIYPSTPGIFRTIFLYVGQGESTLMIIPDGENYKTMLIDCNIDHNPKEINIVKLLKDLLGDDKLDYFVNTHPHLDHLEGIKDVYDNVGIKEVWHSGHVPKGDHKDIFQDLQNIIQKVGEKDVYCLLGSNEINKLDNEEHKVGDIDYQVLSPAEYVADDIADEDDETHYRRIHEHCGVIKFSYGEEPASILMTGDSDIDAWEKHITEYHKDNLNSDILSASHHGSRTFFKKNEDDEPYLEHIINISPWYVVVSSPTKEESRHNHPHDDALDLYKKHMQVEDELGGNLFHLGSEKYCLIVDIYPDGTPHIYEDFDIIEEYGFKDDSSDEDKSNSNLVKNFYPITKIEKDKPMGK